MFLNLDQPSSFDAQLQGAGPTQPPQETLKNTI